jgi:hypothetical protein
VYAPDKAMPMFDYREFSGLILDKSNIASYISLGMCSTMLNTMNYFVNRKNFLSCWDGSIDPIGSDSIFQNYNWLKGGRRFYCVPDLSYEHRVHSESHFQHHIHESMPLINDVIEKLRQLK